MKRKIGAFIGLWIVISGAAFASPGCYGRNCEGGVETFGGDQGEGVMIDPDTWASSRSDDPWLPFPRQRFYIFDIKALGGRTPKFILPYVSAAQTPNKTGDDFVNGAGNLTKLKWAGPNHIEIFNDSCSDFYLWLVLAAPPLPPGSPDAGNNDTIDPDAGADAGDDAN